MIFLVRKNRAEYCQLSHLPVEYPEPVPNLRVEIKIQARKLAGLVVICDVGKDKVTFSRCIERCQMPILGKRQTAGR